MTLPLDFPDFILLISAWSLALVVALVELASNKYRGREPSHPILLALWRYLCMGSFFTILLVAIEARSRQLISGGFLVLTLLVATLLSVSSEMVGRLERREPTPKAENEAPAPAAS